MKNRTVYLILAIVIIISGLSSCNDGDIIEPEKIDDTNSEAFEEIESVDLLEMRKQISDDLPDTNLNGAEFRISAMTSRQYEAYAESETAEVTNDAVYKRNRTVEERFNVEIKTILIEDTNYVSSITNSIMADDDLYDVSTMNTYLADSLILKELCQSWKDIPHINFTKPWWIQNAIESYTVAGNFYVAVGSFNTTTLLRTYAIFFNKQLTESYEIDDIYKTVTDGKWTIEMLDKISKDIYTDINGDNTRDNSDTYGFTADAQTCLDTFLTAADIPIFGSGEGGYPEFCLDLDKASTLFDRVYKLYYDNTGTFISNDTAELINMFTGSQTIFYATWMDNAFKSELREMKDDYGILPWPKYDEVQLEYFTTSMDNVSALILPKTSANLDMVGLITEALYAESYKTVMPAYYDVALKTKLNRDEQSIAMLDLIMDGITYDFAFLHYPSLMGITQVFRSLINSKSNTFVSYITSIESAINERLNNLIEVYKGLE